MCPVGAVRGVGVEPEVGGDAVHVAPPALHRMALEEPGSPAELHALLDDVDAEPDGVGRVPAGTDRSSVSSGPCRIASSIARGVAVISSRADSSLAARCPARIRVGCCLPTSAPVNAARFPFMYATQSSSVRSAVPRAGAAR